MAEIKRPIQQQDIEWAHEVSERLTEANIGFGVYSGAHAALLAGHRQTTDIDIWADEKKIPELQAAFPEAQVEVTRKQSPEGLAYDGFMLALGKVSIMGATADYVDGVLYPVGFSPASGRIRYQTLDGLTTNFVDPADTVLIKARMQRGRDQGKHDIDDILAVSRATTIDRSYLLKRIQETKSWHRVVPLLSKLGVLTATDIEAYEYNNKITQEEL